MLTTLGRFLRKLRIDNLELLKDMADKIGMSSAMLSAIENGKRSPQADFVDRIADAYRLSADAKQELIAAFCEVQNEVKINIKNKSANDQKLAFSFARRFNELDDQSKNEIMNILGGRGV